MVALRRTESAANLLQHPSAKSCQSHPAKIHWKHPKPFPPHFPRFYFLFPKEMCNSSVPFHLASALTSAAPALETLSEYRHAVMPAASIRRGFHLPTAIVHSQNLFDWKSEIHPPPPPRKATAARGSPQSSPAAGFAFRWPPQSAAGIYPR